MVVVAEVVDLNCSGGCCQGKSRPLTHEPREPRAQPGNLAPKNTICKRLTTMSSQIVFALEERPAPRAGPGVEVGNLAFDQSTLHREPPVSF